MRIISKALSIILLGSIFLTSCGAVTPIPEATSTATVTPRSVVPTSTIESTPTEKVISQSVAGDYKLKPWDANNPYYAELIGKFNEGTYDINSSSQRYARVFKAEKILRDPSQDWREIAWQIVADYPNGIPLPGMRSDEDLLSYLIEDALNNQGVTPDGLFDLLEEKIQSFDRCLGMDFDDASLASPGDRYLKVPNLFGDGKTALVFYTSHKCESGAVYVLRDLSGVYLVTKIKDWQALSIPFAGYYLKLFSVGDTNGNRIPEVIVETYFGASGDPQYWSQKLDWYEWDSAKSIFITDNISVFGQGCDKGPCGGEWEFGSANVQNSHPLITHEFYFTEFDLYKDPSEACPNLDFQSVYLWNGSKFVRQSKQIKQSTSNLPECQILWAYRALELDNGANDAAIKILTQAIENWPSSMNVIFGPASRDYFSLKLGIWYDHLGEEVQSTRVLQNLAESPVDSDYNFASRLAAKYLDIRSDRGIIQACDEIEYLKNQSLNTIVPSPYVYMPIDKLVENWGFGYQGWSHQTDLFCDTKDAMATVVRSVPFKGVDEWLSSVDVTPRTIQKLDLSIDTWLVEIPYKDFSMQYVADKDAFLAKETLMFRWWLLVNSPNGLSVAYVFNGDKDTVDMAPSVEELPLSKNGQIVLVKFNYDVLAFYIDTGGRLITLPDDLYGEVYVSDGQIVMLENDYFSDTKNIYAYRWNSEEQDLKQETLNYDFDAVQRQIENTIFRDQNYSSAIALINVFFVQAPSEPIIESSCTSNGCDYYPEWYWPYMRFLLALAYEMSGQADEARDTYFALWQDYPTNTFGVAASLKLEEVSP